MGSYSVCSFVSDLFHLVQCLQVLSMSHMHVSELRFFLRLNNTPLLAHTTFCLSIHPLMDTGAVSSFGSSENPHCGHCHKNRLASVFSCLYYLWIPTNPSVYHLHLPSIHHWHPNVLRHCDVGERELLWKIGFLHQLYGCVNMNFIVSSLLE